MATDYDKGKLTSREKQAGKNQAALSKYSDQTLTNAAEYNRNSANTIENWNENNAFEIANRNAQNTNRISEYNAGATRQQLGNQLGNYDFANSQNADLRDTQLTQAGRKSEAERFEAQRQLQNAALGLFGSMNQAMNGSTIGNAMSMLRNRNDSDNSTYWQTLQDNVNAVQNAYDESYNQNQVAKRDAAISAIKSLQDINSDLSSNLNNVQTDLLSDIGTMRGDLFSNLSNIESDLFTNRRNLRGDLAANLNNVNPNLFFDPTGNTKTKLENQLAALQAKKNKSRSDKNKISELKEQIKNLPSSPLGDVGINTAGYAIPGDKADIFSGRYSSIYKAPGTNAAINRYQNEAQSLLDNVKQNDTRVLDYIMPESAEQNVINRRNRLGGNDYFSRLINGFNGR